MDKHEQTRLYNQKLEKFKKKNKLFLNNPLICNFLEHNHHFQLFINAISNPSVENKEKLDEAFKIYYFKVRFTSFVSSTLYFNAINFDKKQQKLYKRFPLTIDSSTLNDKKMTFKESLIDPNSEPTVEKILKCNDISKYIEDPILYEALMSLTEKQREIISLSYIDCLSDSEIARLLNKSQQSVSKIHKRSLEKIQEYLKRKGR